MAGNGIGLIPRNEEKSFTDAIAEEMEAAYELSFTIQGYIHWTILAVHHALLQNQGDPFTRKSLASITAGLFVKELYNRARQDFLEWAIQVIFVQFIDQHIKQPIKDHALSDSLKWLKEFSNFTATHDLTPDLTFETSFECCMPTWMLRSREILSSTSCHGTWFKKLHADVFHGKDINETPIADVKGRLFKRMKDLLELHLPVFKDVGQNIEPKSVWDSTLLDIMRYKERQCGLLQVVHRNVLAECYTTWQNQYLFANECIFVSDKDKETRVVEMANQLRRLRDENNRDIDVHCPKMGKERSIFVSSNRFLDQCACIDLALKLNDDMY